MNPSFTNYGASGLEALYPYSEKLSFNDTNEWVALKKPIPVGTPVELDTLFMTERFQHEINDGFKAWQIPSLNRGLEPAVDSSLTVDHTQWHPIFRKERWYDLKSPVDLNDQSMTAPVWSVDNPDVFYELGMCVEMANKIFDQALGSKFLHTLFFGKWEHAGTTYQRVNQDTGIPADRIKPHGDPNGPLLQSERSALNRQIINAADRIVWTFFDGDAPDRFAWIEVTDGRLTSAYTTVETDKNTGEQFVVICMNARILRTLLQDNDGTSDPPDYLREVEKHVARAQFAITVCFVLHVEYCE